MLYFVYKSQVVYHYLFCYVFCFDFFLSHKMTFVVGWSEKEIFFLLEAKLLYNSLEAKLLYNSVLSFPHSLTDSVTLFKHWYSLTNSYTWRRKISKTVLEIPFQTLPIWLCFINGFAVFGRPTLFSANRCWKIHIFLDFWSRKILNTVLEIALQT